MTNHVMTFLEAVDLAAAMLPGLKNDLLITKNRRNQQCKDMEGIGRWGLEIPDPIIPLLKQYHPELYQEDVNQANREWLRFMQHPDSAPFRVQHTL